MSQTNWEADKMLDVYIHDYLVKRDLKATAQAFEAEGKVSSDPVAIDAPGGFLFEWWSVFWDIFIARNNEKHSDIATASYVESSQMLKARDQQQQLVSPQPQLQQQQHIQMQQLLLQRHAQQQQQQQQRQQQQQQHQLQQRRDGAHLMDGTANGNDPNMQQNSGTVNAMATKMYEERLKLPVQRDCLDEAAQRFCENVGQMLDQNHVSILKSAAASQSSGQVLHGTAGGISTQMQARGQHHPVSTPQDMKTDVNSMMNSKTPCPDGSVMGNPGSNQGSNSLTLKGWPLTGLEQLRPGLLQQQKSFMQASQPFHQLQMLTSQHQQQMLLAQQNMTSASATSASASDFENRRFRMLLNNKMMALGKEGLANSIGDIVPNVGSPLQAACPVLPRGDADMLIKLKMTQLQQQQHQQLNALSCQQPQVPTYNLHLPEKMGPTSSMTMDGRMPNTFRGNDQGSKNQNARKRKLPVSSSGPANSSGTANTAGPSTPSIHTPGDVMSLPSTPSNHTPGDMMMSLTSLAHPTTSAKPIFMFGSGTAGNLATTSNQLADIERFVEDGSLEDNGQSLLSHDDSGLRDACGSDLSKGFTFAEVNSVRASTGKVVCCHFSQDGKILASGGHDKKVVLWNNDTLKPKATLEEHTKLITDVRFSPSMMLATSSFDKSVRVWDADNPSYSLCNFTGHSASVMSLDFHPKKEDLICSCDVDGEIRFWNITNGSCSRVFKGGTAQMRFQPRLGRYIAAAAENVISIFDVETQACQNRLQGHAKPIHSVCWDSSGDLLASVSEDCVRVWSLGAGSEGECVHELTCNANEFYSCAFHPTYNSLLSLELWNMNENKTMTLSAHEGLIAALAASSVTGLVASASHDKIVKLWKCLITDGTLLM
ncbi:hypothetical protein V2J09_004445 [Rumex salicifolius]